MQNFLTNVKAKAKAKAKATIIINWYSTNITVITLLLGCQLYSHPGEGGPSSAQPEK